MTVGQLMDLLEREVEANRLSTTHAVAVWVKGNGGLDAVDIAQGFDVDWTEGFIAFALEAP